MSRWKLIELLGRRPALRVLTTHVPRDGIESIVLAHSQGHARVLASLPLAGLSPRHAPHIPFFLFPPLVSPPPAPALAPSVYPSASLGWRARFSSGRAPPSGGRSRHRHLPAAGHCQRRGFKQLAPNRSNQAGRPGRGSTRWHPTLCCSPRCCREVRRLPSVSFFCGCARSAVGADGLSSRRRFRLPGGQLSL